MKSKALDLLTRLSMFFIIPFLIIALVLYTTGFRGPIQMDATYYNFLQRVSIRANDLQFKIPDIPEIPISQEVKSYGILYVLATFTNFIIKVLNVIIMLLNVVINIFTFIGALISIVYEDFKDMANGSSRRGVADEIRFWHTGAW